jgi:hypothetical protein
MMDSGDMYTLPASCIRGPVIVVPDIEDEGTVSLEDYMAILPRHKMGANFIYHMYEHLEELEGDYVADNREDEVANIFFAAAWCSLCELFSLCGAASSNSMAYNNASFDVPLFLDVRF